MTDYSALQIECDRLRKEIDAAILRKDFDFAYGSAVLLQRVAGDLALQMRGMAGGYLMRDLAQEMRCIQDDYELTDQTADKC